MSTPTGLKAIDTLKIGDLMMSRSDKTGETAAKPIVSITPAHERRIWTATVSYKGEDSHWKDELYETTDDHPWRTSDGGWATSASLKHGQTLARENGIAIVAAVTDTGRNKLTYNLEIADFHTYFVGKSKTWVHNACPPNLRDATKQELKDAALRDGYDKVETWKTQGLGLRSPYNIGVDQNGNLYSYPQRGGEVEFLGINIYE